MRIHFKTTCGWGKYAEEDGVQHDADTAVSARCQLCDTGKVPIISSGKLCSTYWDQHWSCKLCGAYWDQYWSCKLFGTYWDQHWFQVSSFGVYKRPEQVLVRPQRGASEAHIIWQEKAGATTIYPIRHPLLVYVSSQYIHMSPEYVAIPALQYQLDMCCFREYQCYGSGKVEVQ